MTLSRGYKDIRNRINRYPQYNRCCFNCRYYYNKKGDGEELCHNPNVLEYDVCIDNTSNRIYCGFWKGIGKDVSETEYNNDNSKNIFFKGCD